jgi:hypothetical protein
VRDDGGVGERMEMVLLFVALRVVGTERVLNPAATV